MPSKRRSRSRAKRPPAGFVRSAHRFFAKHWRGLSATALAIAIIAGAWLIFDPYADPTAIDANGETVKLGPINESPDARPRAGSPAPNFVLADYDGRAVRLDDFQGKVVFLNFWATWCTACEAEMPDMNRLAAQHPDELIVLAVNRGEGRGQAKRWSDARRLGNVRFVIDPRESISRAYQWLRVEGDAARCGITAFGQEQLRDIVMVFPPRVGDRLEAGEKLLELESTKVLWELFMPVSGEIAEVNKALDMTPELINQDPHSLGWLVVIRFSDASELDGLLDADAYAAFVSSQATG